MAFGSMMQPSCQEAGCAHSPRAHGRQRWPPHCPRPSRCPAPPRSSTAGTPRGRCRGTAAGGSTRPRAAHAAPRCAASRAATRAAPRWRRRRSAQSAAPRPPARLGYSSPEEATQRRQLFTSCMHALWHLPVTSRNCCVDLVSCRASVCSRQHASPAHAQCRRHRME